ncbi:MAG: pectin esterase [Prevotella sp.]|nr:pectin esterase [Prevotella sp.]MBR1462309.1 pectin esterase [Prevotella sp.]
MNCKKALLSIVLGAVALGATASDRVFNLIVAGDGSGDFTTVQAAINAAPANATHPFLIFIKNGIYDELVDIPEDKPFIHLIGQDAENTIIRHTIHCGGKDSQNFEFSVNNPQSENYKHHAVVDNWGSDFYAENITFENSWGTSRQAGPQALAMRTFADRMAFYNCRFRSFQDTWFTTTVDQHRHYIKDCFLEGAVDYIYGSGDVLAEGTTFYNVRSGSVITAPCHTNARYGYVFSNCIVDGNKQAADGNLKLGRPWHNNPVNVWINTCMRIPVAAQGWTDMGTIPRLFAEYNSHNSNGSQLDLSQRKTSYSYKERDTDNIISGSSPTTISKEDASRYTYENIIVGSDQWNPRLFMQPLAAPTKMKFKKGVLQWKPVKDACGYIVTNNAGKVIAVTTKCRLATKERDASYTVRAVSKYGHLGEKQRLHTNKK